MTPPDLEDEESDAPDDTRERILLGNQNRDFTPSPLPVAPDGGPASPPGYVNPVELPDPSEANTDCLRGPCRHYMAFKSTMDIGNSKGIFEEGKAPREDYRYCTAIPGDPIDMGPMLVTDCNRWDPEDDSESYFTMRDRRRAIYHENHPEQRVVDDAADLPDDDSAAPATTDAGAADTKKEITP